MLGGSVMLEQGRTAQNSTHTVVASSSSRWKAHHVHMLKSRQMFEITKGSKFKEFYLNCLHFQDVMQVFRCVDCFGGIYHQCLTSSSRCNADKVTLWNDSESLSCEGKLFTRLSLLVWDSARLRVGTWRLGSIETGKTLCVTLGKRHENFDTSCKQTVSVYRPYTHCLLTFSVAEWRSPFKDHLNLNEVVFSSIERLMGIFSRFLA